MFYQDYRKIKESDGQNQLINFHSTLNKYENQNYHRKCWQSSYSTEEFFESPSFVAGDFREFHYSKCGLYFCGRNGRSDAESRLGWAGSIIKYVSTNQHFLITIWYLLNRIFSRQHTHEKDLRYFFESMSMLS